MAGDKSGSTTDDAYSNQQVGQGSKVNRAGQNTRKDSEGRSVNFNVGPATVGQKTAPDRVLSKAPNMCNRFLYFFKLSGSKTNIIIFTA